jgi:hypothetical protein
MPFCAIPTDIQGILARRRVVINEPHVFEFALAREITNNNTLPNARMTSTLSVSNTKKHKRFSEFISGGYSSSQSNNNNSSSSSSSSSHQYHPPVTAPSTTFNPFYENRFLVRNYSFIYFLRIRLKKKHFRFVQKSRA